MQYDVNDVVRIQVARDEPFMCDHYPLMAGRLPDGRESYVFDLDGEDELWYEGSGPTPEEARFLRRSSEGNLILASPSPSDKLSLWVLRYDPDAYMHCEYYTDEMKMADVGRDPTGPFSWKFNRYLPAFYSAQYNTE